MDIDSSVEDVLESIISSMWSKAIDDYDDGEVKTRLELYWQNRGDENFLEYIDKRKKESKLRSFLERLLYYRFNFTIIDEKKLKELIEVMKTIERINWIKDKAKDVTALVRLDNYFFTFDSRYYNDVEIEVMDRSYKSYRIWFTTPDCNRDSIKLFNLNLHDLLNNSKESMLLNRICHNNISFEEFKTIVVYSFTLDSFIDATVYTLHEHIKVKSEPNAYEIYREEYISDYELGDEEPRKHYNKAAFIDEFGFDPEILAAGIKKIIRSHF